MSSASRRYDEALEIENERMAKLLHRVYVIIGSLTTWTIATEVRKEIADILGEDLRRKKSDAD